MEVHPGVTELWDVVGVVIGVLGLQEIGVPEMLELVSSLEKISLSEYPCLQFHWLT